MSDMDRDDQFTADLVRLAARRAGVNPERILAMAQARTLPGPVRDGWTRDLVHEALEELADAINYGPWDAKKQLDLGAPGLPIAQEHYLNALGHVVAAFEQFVYARDALHDGCNRCGGRLVPADGEFIPVLECERCGRVVPR